MKNKFQIIAEVKTQSPFGYTSEYSWNQLFESANKIGDIISIHTDSRWGGSFDLIKKAKSLTSKPILAKGIHGDDLLIQKAIDAGADFVLVVGRIPSIHIEKCLLEPLTLDELKGYSPNIKAVWNSLDLSNGKFKTESFKEARNIFKGWLCQASNIKTINDVEDGSDAILIGTNLLTFASSLSKQGDIRHVK